MKWLGKHHKIILQVFLIVFKGIKQLPKNSYGKLT